MKDAPKEVWIDRKHIDSKSTVAVLPINVVTLDYNLSLVSDVKYIRADLVPQWQPIETAPKDGRLVLARWHSGDDWTGTFTAYYSALNQSWMYSVARPIANLTHWQPIPQPPK